MSGMKVSLDAAMRARDVSPARAADDSPADGPTASNPNGTADGPAGTADDPAGTADDPAGTADDPAGTFHGFPGPQSEQTRAQDRVKP
jgi:hypothetical protein